MAENRQGLRRHLFQFSLLVVINGCVGAMVGMERSILPPIAETEFGITGRTAMLSFIVVFGITKALSNYYAGRLADTVGRKKVLVSGWLLAIPVPLLLMWAPSWGWILVANIFLGMSQGLTWSVTVIMKIDLVGPKHRGLAMGWNEFAGYSAMASTAWLTGWLAEQYSLRPAPFYPGLVLVGSGLLLSASLVHETRGYARQEQKDREPSDKLSQKEVFRRTTFSDRSLSSATQAGVTTNLKDGMAWGLFPLFFGAAGMSLKQIGVLTAVYPAVWGVLQLVTGTLSDRIGRKLLIYAGMWVQAAALAWIAVGSGFWWFFAGAAALGVGTAMAYPVLLAAVSDHAEPLWRGSALGVYRLWRDGGYAAGAIAAGVFADFFGMQVSFWLIAILTFGSGLVVLFRMDVKS